MTIMHYEFMLPVGYAWKFTSGSPLLIPLPLMNNDKIRQCVRSYVCVCMCVCGGYVCVCGWVGM